MPFTSPKRAAALLATALTAAGAATASPAQALTTYTPTGHECTLSASLLGVNIGPALADPLGYRFDTTPNLTLFAGLPAQYATLAAGSSTTAVAGKTVSGAYYNWGDLFVGATETRATQYLDADPLGCNTERSGRQTAFATKTMNGLEVQRTLYVPSSGPSGARLVESLRNPGTTPVTTSVFVGDMTSQLNAGSLGSFGQTVIGATSSGDATIDADDRWAVTSDGATSSNTPAVAHIWDGPGGDEQTSTERSGAQAGNESLDTEHQLAPGKFGYGWQNITVPAGGTASYLSWELMRATGTSGSTARDAAQTLAAKTAATEFSAGSLSAIYAGMTPAEIASVRNWAKPTASATVAPISGATTAAPVTIAASAVDYGSSTIAACSTGWLSWDFGDGTTAIGAGANHHYDAGQHTVTVTAHGDCGGQSTSQLHFTVAAPDPVVSAGNGSGAIQDPAADPAQTTAPAVPAAAASDEPTSTTQAVSGPAPASGSAATTVTPAVPLILTAMPKIDASQIAKKGVDATVQSSAGGALRFVLTGTGIKLVKITTIKPGAPQTTTLKFPPSANKALKTVKTLQLRAKLTLPGGAEIISTRPITVHH